MALSNRKRNHQHIHQTQKELNKDPSYAYRASQHVSPTSKEPTKASKFCLFTGYVSDGSDTQIVVCRLYPSIMLLPF
jgi:hypothetical protein